ncbi:leucine-rich repeat domain-containing protein [Acholeplasma equirhinis]|uniref:leucine-rich repeat domain-containing protein n=1 Tax=Acholeplasma equirhinis TaxID=555393 RepID=UPI00197A8846|nr:leucine-rich repeat domain-containing protein [Acholeplasma equirhinis]MBN3489918.1 leucine-rich repeat domain-containing protein [Acholeplasma equirhinis]
MGKVFNLNIPKDMYHITDEYMSKQRNLKSVNIHSKVKKLDHGAFFNQTKLKKVYIEAGSNITVIPVGCFEGCTELEKIKLPNQLITIQKHAFKNCTSIKELRIPDEVVSIDPNAFDGWKEDQVIISPIQIKQPITCKAQIYYDEEEFLEHKKVVRDKHGINYYLVTVKCGHVGRDKYMPITFPVMAHDRKQASDIARVFPRVKKDHPDVVISAELVTEEQYYKQVEENNKDPYLHIKRKMDQKKIMDLIEHRLVLETNYKRRN